MRRAMSPLACHRAVVHGPAGATTASGAGSADPTNPCGDSKGSMGANHATAEASLASRRARWEWSTGPWPLPTFSADPY